MANDPTPGYKVEPPKPPTRKKKRKPVKQGTRRERDPKFGLDRLVPEVKDPIKVAVEQARPAAVNRRERQFEETLRRQRLLAQQGLGVVVDGVWGPRSQKAWNDYLTRTTAGKIGPIKAEKGPRALPMTLTGPEQQYLVKQEEEKRAAQRAEKQRKAERAKILSNAKALKLNPSEARAYKFHDLASVLLDPEAKLELHTPQGARVFQEWAVANRIPNVTITGKYDRQTHDAMTAQLKREENKARRLRVRRIVHDLYGPAGITGGQSVSWLPYGDGKVPTAVELDAMIQDDARGFEATTTLNAILERSATGGVVFDSMRRSYLMQEAAKLQPFGKGGQPKWLQKAGGTGGTQLQLYADILGIKVLAPLGDVSMFRGNMQAVKTAEMMRNREWLQQNGRAVGRLHNEIHILASSTTPEEFATRLGGYLKDEEAAFQLQQKQYAAENTSWWGKAIDTMLAPGKWSRTALTYNAMLLDYTLETGAEGANDAIRALVPGYDSIERPGHKRPQWEDSLAWWGEAPDWYKGDVEKASAWNRLPIELVVDPLNIVAPLRAGAASMRGTAWLAAQVGVGSGQRFASLGTYALVKDGWQTGLRYQKGTWSKAAVLGSVDDFLTAGHGIHKTAAFKRAAALTSRSVALRSEAFAGVRFRVEQNVRHGFKPPRARAASMHSFMDDLTIHEPKSMETRNLIDEGWTATKAWIRGDEGMNNLVDDLIESKVSLYVHATKPTRSNVGASIFANLIEKGRIGALHQAATHEAYRIWEAGIAKVEAQGLADEAQKEALETLAKQAYDEYKLVVNGSGNFLKGGFLAKGGQADKAVMQRVEQHIKKRMDDLENVVFPVMQDMLEEAAELRGYSLWDEAGLWAGRKGETATRIRGYARESFEDGKLVKQDNPNFGVAFTRAERDELIDAEVRRRASRVSNYQHRQVTGDLNEGTFTAREGIERETADVARHWEQRHGQWFDTREKVEVSDLYTRHTTDAFMPDANGEMLYRGRPHAGADDGSWLTRLQQLSDAPVNVAGGELDDALWRFTWDMGTRYKMRAPTSAVHPTRRYLGPRQGADESTDEFNTRVTEEFAKAKRLSDAVNITSHGLGRAWDEALPRELMKETAVWQALAHAQGRVAKLAYLGLKGALNTWVFATLALRPGWMVRNVIDNAAKLIVAGVRDPRMFFLGGASPGSAVASVFDMGLVPIRQMIQWLDGLFGTDGLSHWMRLEEMVWTQSADALGRIFAAHGVEVPEQVLDGARFRPFEDRPVDLHGPRGDEDELIELGLMRESNRVELAGDELADLYKRFRDGAFELMGNRPENYFKRILYRDEFMKVRKELMESGRFTRPNMPLRPWKVEVDEKAFRSLAEDVLGPVAQRLDIRFTKHDVNNLPRYSGQFSVSEDGGAVLEVVIPDGIMVRSQEQSVALNAEVAKSALHELRHAKQFIRSERIQNLQRAIDSRLSYRFQYGEIDANIWMRRKQALGKTFLTDRTGAPSYYDTIAIEQHAFKAAWEKVEATLFDYSKISTLEDNFRVFFPFIQFWRKNTHFWAAQGVSKPWLPLAVLKVDEERREAHADLPSWMRRYIHVDEIADAASVIPGLDTIVRNLIPGDTQYDPFNLLSFAPLYRTLPKLLDELGEEFGMEKGLQDRLKTENPSLPGEKEGHWLFGPMIDAVSDFGLGMSPFARKPLESANIASERAWQMMFPQTSVAVALTRQFWGDNAALTVAGWESLWGRLPLGVKSDAIAEQFDYYVQQFVAEQVARGETADLEAAKKAVRHWFLTQNLYGYFTGMYLRRATPEDMYLAKLADGDYADIPDEMQEAVKLWRMRGANRLTFERYLEVAPLIEAYYRTGDDWERKVQMKRDHPEIIQYVDATWRGRPFSGKWARNATRYTQTAKFFRALEIVDSIDAPYEVRQAALDVFKSPGLEKYWKENNTLQDERDAMLQGVVREYYAELNKGYFELPDDDYEARDGYLAEHPELIRHWNRNNDPVDDYEAMIGGANAALREMYFAIVGSHKDESKGFEAAAPFLKAFRFMFEDTKSAHKIDMKTGEWIITGGTGKNKWSAERINAFREVKPHLDWFFDTFMKQYGKDAAWKWLRETTSERAKLIREYLDKYGKDSQKKLDYMRARPYLKLYFDMPKDVRGKWLAGDSEGAKIVKAYFEKYASKKGQTQHARDYLAVKSQLDAYFKMPKSERGEWLKSGSPAAKAVLAYFKKYGQVNKYERAFVKRFPKLAGGTPEQRKRLEFWRQYFTLTPDKRPAFILAQAEEHGVFIYGEFGEEARHDREMEYQRKAVGAGLSKKQSAYLYARPLLDFYYKLPKGERALFARLNPEINEYLDKWADRKLSGDKALDADIEAYFKLPPDSLARSAWLREHPKVQDWFDSKSSPADAAMRNLLEQYFALGGRERKEFAEQHPEIPAYFERNRAEQSLEGDIYDAFDHSDPRLTRFFDDADDLIRAAEAMKLRLRNSALKRFTPDSIESRRDRREPSPYL